MLEAVAKRHGATGCRICLAWLLALTPAMLPIQGASKVCSSAISSAAAADLVLEPADLAALAARFPAVRV